MSFRISIEDYPEDIIESLIANSEKEDYIFNYPLKKDTYSNQKLIECIGQSQMPLLLQWDDRWGYYPYGNGIIGVMGCGPTSLSMVALHLLQEAGLDENVVMRHLRQGRPIICAMGPGDFTKTGHFIVLVAEENGKIRINDCNSISRSSKLWEFEEFKDQIRNMWAYSVR